MKLVLGLVLGATGTITLLYMVVSIANGIRCLIENAAKEQKKSINEIINDKIYSFSAFIVVFLMIANLLIIVCDRLYDLV